MRSKFRKRTFRKKPFGSYKKKFTSFKKKFYKKKSFGKKWHKKSYRSFRKKGCNKKTKKGLGLNKQFVNEKYCFSYNYTIPATGAQSSLLTLNPGSILALNDNFIAFIATLGDNGFYRIKNVSFSVHEKYKQVNFQDYDPQADDIGCVRKIGSAYTFMGDDILTGQTVDVNANTYIGAWNSVPGMKKHDVMKNNIESYFNISKYMKKINGTYVVTVGEDVYDIFDDGIPSFIPPSTLDNVYPNYMLYHENQKVTPLAMAAMEQFTIDITVYTQFKSNNQHNVALPRKEYTKKTPFKISIDPSKLKKNKIIEETKSEMTKCDEKLKDLTVKLKNKIAKI